MAHGPATQPLTGEQLAPIGWDGQQGLEDARNLIHYYRLTPGHRIVMGSGPVGLGRGGDLDHDRDQKAWRHLEQHLHWLWPHLSGVTIIHRWGGPFSVTMGLTPALGYLGQDRTAVCLLGCIGHGVAMSYQNGQVLADLLTGYGAGRPPANARSSTGGSSAGHQNPPPPQPSTPSAATCKPKAPSHERVTARAAAANAPPDRRRVRRM